MLPGELARGEIRASDPRDVEQIVYFRDITVSIQKVRLADTPTQAICFLLLADPLNLGVVWFRDELVNSTNRNGMPLGPGKSLVVSLSESQRLADAAELPGAGRDPREYLGAGFRPNAARMILDLSRYWLAASAENLTVHLEWQGYTRTY